MSYSKLTVKVTQGYNGGTPKDGKAIRVIKVIAGITFDFKSHDVR
jgi:hypothetical protein